MPATRRRIRPVIEEIVEPTPAAPSPKEPDVSVSEVSHHDSRKRVRIEEEVPVETQQEVAAYDEPPLLEKVVPTAPVMPQHAEAAARALLDSDIPSRRRGTNFKLILFVTIVTALIVGFIAGGVYVYMSGVSNNQVVESTPTPTPLSVDTTPTPKPSATPTIVPSSFNVSVLNGSGVIGAAGKVKASLEAGGFKVTGTGNAANYSFKNTVVQTKASVPAQALDLLKKALKDYVVEEGDSLPTSSTFDIIVTAGKQ